ncbi:hypothetical protein BGZ58_006613, partial [Dissophora ornata]
GNYFELTSAIRNMAASDRRSYKVVFSISASQMNVFDQKALSDFMTTVDVKGPAMDIANTSLGTVHLTVPLKTSQPLQCISFAG